MTTWLTGFISLSKLTSCQSLCGFMDVLPLWRFALKTFRPLTGRFAPVSGLFAPAYKS